MYKFHIQLSHSVAGISGRVPESRERVKSSSLGEGAFAKISARIPPPPSKEDSDDHDGNDRSDDYDWE